MTFRHHRPSILAVVVATLLFGIGPALAQPCNPPRPVITSCVPGNCSVYVEWQPDPNVYRFSLTRYHGNGCRTTLLADSTATSYTDTSALSGVQSYVVEAWYNCNSRRTSLAATCDAGQANPPEFTGFYASTTRCIGVELSYPTCLPRQTLDVWRVWRSRTMNFSDAIELPPFPMDGTHPLVDTSAAPDVEYWYWMQPSTGACTQGTRRGPVRGVARPLSTPPSALVATRGTWCRGISLNWSPVGCSDLTHIHRGTTPRFEDAAEIASVARTQFEYVDTAALADVEYVYWVTAQAGDHTSGPSLPAAGWHTPNTPPTAEPLPDGFCFCYGDDTGVFTYDYSGGDELSVQWRREGVPLTDDDRIHGSRELSMFIWNTSEADYGFYDAVVTSACGVTVARTLPFPSLFRSCPPFLSDYNEDGGVDGADVYAFILDWESAAPCADVNHDGGIDGEDLAEWINCWESC